jgi:hypothetical protein
MNKYIEKIAESKDETHTRALLRGTRALGRGWGESILGGISGASIGGALGKIRGGGAGAAAGGVLGGMVGGTLGAVHGTGRSVQNQAAEMKKQASTRLSRYVDEMGLPGSGRNGEAYLGSAALNKAFTGESPTGQVLSGGITKTPIHSLFSGREIGEKISPNTATRSSYDALARQPAMADRLATLKARDPSAGPVRSIKPNIPGAKPTVGNLPKAAPQGILSKALSMAKRHPLAAGLAGATALGGLAYAAGNRSGQQSAQPQGMYYQ